MKTRTRVLDLRGAMGQPPGHVEMPTLAIPERCHAVCTWVVVRPGLGLKAVSRLKYASGACPHRHVPQQEQP